MKSEKNIRKNLFSVEIKFILTSFDTKLHSIMNKEKKNYILPKQKVMSEGFSVASFNEIEAIMQQNF